MNLEITIEVIGIIIGLICTIWGAVWTVMKLTISKEINPIKAVMNEFKTTFANGLNELKFLIRETHDKTNNNTKDIAVTDNKAQAAHYRVDNLEERLEKLENKYEKSADEISKIKTVCNMKNGTGGLCDTK